MTIQTAMLAKISEPTKDGMHGKSDRCTCATATPTLHSKERCRRVLVHLRCSAHTYCARAFVGFCRWQEDQYVCAFNVRHIAPSSCAGGPPNQVVPNFGHQTA